MEIASAPVAGGPTRRGGTAVAARPAPVAAPPPAPRTSRIASGRRTTSQIASGRRTTSQTDGGRRTVTIRGHGAERNLPVARPKLRRHERPGFRPDLAALWAVLLGLCLILVAAASAHGAVLH